MQRLQCLTITYRIKAGLQMAMHMAPSSMHLFAITGVFYDYVQKFADTITISHQQGIFARTFGRGF